MTIIAIIKTDILSEIRGTFVESFYLFCKTVQVNAPFYYGKTLRFIINLTLFCILLFYCTLIIRILIKNDAKCHTYIYEAN